MPSGDCRESGETVKRQKRPDWRCRQNKYQPGVAEIPKDFLIFILSDARSQGK